MKTEPITIFEPCERTVQVPAGLAQRIKRVQRRSLEVERERQNAQVQALTDDLVRRVVVGVRRRAANAQEAS